MKQKLVLLGTRFALPFMVEVGAHASLYGWKEILGDGFSDVVLYFDGDTVHSYRKQADMDHLEKVILRYAASKKFKQEEHNIRRDISVFSKIVQNSNTTPVNVLEKFTPLYSMQGITHVLANIWSEQIPGDQKKEILHICETYRMASDCLYTLMEKYHQSFLEKGFDDFAGFDDINSGRKEPEMHLRAGYVFSRHGYESIAWSEFLDRDGYFVDELETEKAEEVITGICAQEGSVRGKVCIVFGPNNFGKIENGDIVVSPMTMPTFLPILKKAGAIVTDEGGALCHAAIVSRELGKPCVIGTKNATQVLKDGMLVEVDANEGVIRIAK